jgi:hypothetical protein
MEQQLHFAFDAEDKDANGVINETGLGSRLTNVDLIFDPREDSPTFGSGSQQRKSPIVNETAR